MGQRAHLDVDADQAAQAGGQRGHADVPVAGVGDHDHVGARARRWCCRSSAGERVGADLLLALDEHRDADRQVVADARAARRGGRRSRPCRRRRRGRRAGRRARSARTAGSPSRRGRSRAARRGGRRAAPSARPRGPALCAITAGAPPSAADDLDAVEALGAEQLGHRLGAALHLARARRVGADRLDPDQVLEVLADPGQHAWTRLELVDVVAHLAATRRVACVDAVRDGAVTVASRRSGHRTSRTTRRAAQPSGRYGVRSARSPEARTRPAVAGGGPVERAGGERDPGLGVESR